MDVQNLNLVEINYGPMPAELQSLIQVLNGKLINDELYHDIVDEVYAGPDLNNISDQDTNILLITNLVHHRILEIAEEVDLIAVCFSHGHEPKQKDLERAKELEMDMFSSPLSLAEAKKTLEDKFGIKVKSLNP